MCFPCTALKVDWQLAVCKTWNACSYQKILLASLDVQSGGASGQKAYFNRFYQKIISHLSAVCSGSPTFAVLSQNLTGVVT